MNEQMNAISAGIVSATTEAEVIKWAKGCIDSKRIGAQHVRTVLTEISGIPFDNLTSHDVENHSQALSIWYANLWFNKVGLSPNAIESFNANLAQALKSAFKTIAVVTPSMQCRKSATPAQVKPTSCTFAPVENQDGTIKSVTAIGFTLKVEHPKDTVMDDAGEKVGDEDILDQEDGKPLSEQGQDLQPTASGREYSPMELVAENAGNLGHTEFDQLVRELRDRNPARFDSIIAELYADDLKVASVKRMTAAAAA